MRALDVLFLPIHIATGFALFGIGYWVGGVAFGTSLLVWGMFLRLVLVLHATWLVNSASHMWGYRNYETTDDSRNNWLVAIVAYGEGWHNNHHAYPRMAKHGHKWWEFDITWQAIRLLRATGLVWDVVDYRNSAEKKDIEAQQAA
jgi:stearoyl-CoA desaturase (delta-9 desaturase)